MSELDSMRHAQIHDPNEYRHRRVAVIGVGTIGSHTALTLARMQVPMVLYDADTIEGHNLATQSYSQADLGKKKVEAVREQIDALGSSVQHFTADSEYAGEEFPEPVHLIVSCVDSLDARRAIAQGMIDNQVNVPVVDGRVGQEQVEVYYFPSPEAWLAQLPESADTDPCGARFTAYTANVAAGFIANNVKRALLNQDIPGRIIYDAATSIFIKEN